MTWNGTFLPLVLSALSLLVPTPYVQQSTTSTGKPLQQAADRTIAEIPWRSPGIQETRPRPSRSQMGAVLDGLAGAPERSHFVLQLDRPLSQHTRNRLRDAGILVLNSLRANAYFASASPLVDSQKAMTITSIVDVREQEAVWKLHPTLARGEFPNRAFVGSTTHNDPVLAAYVVFHEDVSLELDGVNLVHQLGGRVMDRLESIHGLVVEIPHPGLIGLAEFDAVMWIEPPLPRMSTTNDSARARIQADTAQAAPYNLDGTGISVLVYDGGFARASHDDFGGRLTVRDSSGLSNHATHVSGTVGGDGSASGGTNRGMAPAVTIESYGFEFDGTGIFLYTNPGDIESDYNQAINTFGVDISNNSIGTNTEPNGFLCNFQGDYGVCSSVIDAIVRGSLGAPFRVVWANGNERQGSSCDIEGFGDYYSTAPPATAKNHIAVGALNSNNDTMTSFSSWGPTDDGRLKPDISGPGCQSNGDGGLTSTGSASDTAYSTLCGTSMAAPSVTGALALFLEDFRAQYPALPDPRNSTLKAFLAQTASDQGNVGPDYQFGYGSVRIVDAIDHMRTGQFTEDSLSFQGGSLVYTVNVNPGDDFEVTLAWDDVPGTPNVSKALVNDLDLIVTDPMGTRHFPWTLDPANPGVAAVRTAADHTNNIEQVTVDSPAAGTWTIEIHGFDIPSGPQPFSLVSSHALTLGPSVRISFVDDLPTSLTPGVSTTVTAEITGIGDTVVASSPTLHVRYDGGPFLALPMGSIGGDQYQVDLPPPICTATPEFYFSAAGVTSGTLTNPLDAPTTTFQSSVTTVTTVFSDNFQTNQGWTVQNVSLTDGAWERGVPAGLGDRCDPAMDFDGSGQCYVTDNVAGNSDVDGGPTRLTSPTINLSGANDPVVSYARWFCNNINDADRLLVQISDNGGSSWQTVETLADTSGWGTNAFRVLDHVTLTSNTLLRFEVSDNPNDSIDEAAVDAVEILDFECNATLDDCNENSIVDSDDIASGRSTDTNSNGVPDECEAGDCDNDGTPDNLEPDCNNNGTPDDCESFTDCNSNGIPDECEADCDSDGIPDDCESDCDTDGTPDDCETDCNSNGTPDDCEALADCNTNGIPDVCETITDCNSNGIPDECEADCDSDGIPDDCEPDCDTDGTPDDCEPDCDTDGIPDDCEPDCDADSIPDDCEPDCDSDGLPDDCEDDCNSNGTPDDCEALADCNTNGIPDVCETITDCNSNGIPDECEADCDSDGIPDDCEPDCDSDGTPDECENDCNSNGTPDDCEALADCNTNGIPDVCEAITDCNTNGIPDECEADCDSDGIPDDCEPDCDSDGTPDDCEADCNSNGTPDDCEGLADCNTNGIPDVCETITDCNTNGIPDECEADCDSDGIPDDCEPDCDSDGTPDDCEADCNSNGTPDDCEALADCNTNGIPDVCETITDCNTNGIPDECEADCDSDGIPDDCEPDCDSDGTPDDCENDCNSNGTPDDCEALADCNTNGIPDVCETITDCNTNGIPDECEADCDSDGIPDDCEPDCDSDGTPDDCETDCNSNGTPDDCEALADCNTNGIPDVCEVITDCNTNGIPDECEADCDSDGIPDDCEPDCDSDGTPDDCEADCNSNGTPDDCEALADCNTNGIPDVCETITDCNTNGIPDECEADCDSDGIPDDCEPDCDSDGTPDDCETDCNSNGTPDDCEALADCNTNGIPDVCETITDCNSNGIPDECEADCDSDGIPDDCEPDCDADGTPDDCETDCNSNGTPDDCEALADCNTNGIPDVCEVITDCNTNGIPDECEADCDSDGIPDDCEPDCDSDGTPDDCEDDCNSNGTPDDCEALADCNTNGIPDVCETITDCNSNGIPDECEPDCDSDGIPDDCEPDCDSDGTPDDCEDDCNSNGTPDDCEALADCNTNGIPDVCETITDCNSNGIPDECEPDCDSDGIPDDCEPDCDSDGTPDDCEDDCNSNGTPDDCEGLADCNTNGIPDVCETITDCNSNGIPDECEPDCDSDGIPDDCEPDCDSDGTPDDCEADCNSNGTPDDCEALADCNTNGIPDVCEVLTDCNSNGVPDECEADCDSDGIPDDCEPDCDSDGTPDDCETDCNSNGTPDDCEALADCNTNGIPDVCETITDCNSNGIPDECEPDCDSDGIPDACEPDCDSDGTPDDCEADCNSNGTPDDCEGLDDCNTNGIPDVCETFDDCNSNGIPDECETDSNGNGIPDDCEIVDVIAKGESTVHGTSTGTYADTHDGDGISQALEEVETGGRVQVRTSHLDHRWTYSVAPSTSILVHVRAHHSANTEGDRFALSWSEDGTNFAPLLTVTKTADDGMYQTAMIPTQVTGQITIRAEDTDRFQGFRGLDTLFIDHMFLRTANSIDLAPVAASDLDAASVSSSRIDLTWRDNAGDETGFRIESSNDGLAFTTLATVGANVVSYSDTGLGDSTTRHYRVVALNAAGDAPASNADQATTAGPGTSDAVSDGETSVLGSVRSGGHPATHVGDGVFEVLREEQSEGLVGLRTSHLEHKWTFDVSSASSLELIVKAMRSANSDDDNFVFAYSTDDVTYTDLLTISNETDIGYVSASLPPGLSGTVHIRVVDTDRTTGKVSRDRLLVDHLFLRAQ